MTKGIRLIMSKNLNAINYLYYMDLGSYHIINVINLVALNNTILTFWTRHLIADSSKRT
jgi:hypothetical protein